LTKIVPLDVEKPGCDLQVATHGEPGVGENCAATLGLKISILHPRNHDNEH
jgi:hypothetical protein